MLKNPHVTRIIGEGRGEASESYRAAGYKCDRMTNNAIAEEAQRLLKNPRIALAVEKNRAEARERSQVTIEPPPWSTLVVVVLATSGQRRVEGLCRGEDLGADRERWATPGPSPAAWAGVPHAGHGNVRPGAVPCCSASKSAMAPMIDAGLLPSPSRPMLAANCDGPTSCCSNSETRMQASSSSPSIVEPTLLPCMKTSPGFPSGK